MKYVSVLLFVVISLEAVDKSPNWVPEKYRQDFIDMVNACEVLDKNAKEYSETLKATPKLVSCELKDKGLLFTYKRGTVDMSIYQRYDKVVKSCSVDGEDVVIVFDGVVETEGTFMKALKYTAIIAGSIGLGFLLGGGAR